MYEQEFVFDPPSADGTCTDENIKEVFGSMMKTLFHTQCIYIYIYAVLYVRTGNLCMHKCLFITASVSLKFLNSMSIIYVHEVHILYISHYCI
jgi:hypothetical protein